MISKISPEEAPLTPEMLDALHRLLPEFPFSAEMATLDGAAAR
jgi:hypothetical protein